jgi:hypothetical protein
MLGQHALQEEAKQSGREHHNRDSERELDRTHPHHPPPGSRQLAAWRGERNRRDPALPTGMARLMIRL